MGPQGPCADVLRDGWTARAMGGCPQRWAAFLIKRDVLSDRQASRVTGRPPKLWVDSLSGGQLPCSSSRWCWGPVGSVWLRKSPFQRFGLLCALS